MTADNPRAMEQARPQQGRERGAALIEFTLVFPLLLVLTLTVVDVSRAFFVKNLAYQAAREGVRELAVSTMADSARVRMRVLQVTGAANVTLGSLTLSGPNADNLMSVSVGVQYNWIFGGLFTWLGTGAFTNPATLTGVAWMRKEGV